MPPADDDFDIYGEDDGFGTVKEVDEVRFLSYYYYTWDRGTGGTCD